MRAGKFLDSPMGRYDGGMDDVRPRFQFGLRDLLEIVFWVSAGLASLHAAFLMAYPFGPGEVVIIAVLLAPGVAFGIAVGAIVGMRARWALVGFVVWTLLGLSLLVVLTFLPWLGPIILPKFY